MSTLFPLKYFGSLSRRVVITFFLIMLLSMPTAAQVFSDFELKAVEFSGNNLFPASTLEKVILSQESPGSFSQFLYKVFGIGGDAEYFNPSYVSTDIARLRSFYMDNGYFKTQIRSDYSIDSTDGSARLEYIIIEGEPSHVRNFAIEGLDFIYHEFLEMIDTRLTIEKGQLYSAEAVKADRAIITNFLGDRGYMLVYSDRPNILVDTLNNEVDIKINFKPGQRFKVSEIRITRTGGNRDEVDDQLLLDIVDIEPGSYFSYLANQRGEGRLYRTDLFRSALVLPLRNDTTNNSVPLEILAEVGKIYEVSPEIIINDEFNTINLGLGTEFTKRNFLGSARKLTFAVSVVSRDPLLMIKNIDDIKDDNLFGYVDGRLIMEQPFLFGNPIFTRYETYITSQKVKNLYNQWAVGAKVSFNFELPRYTYITSLNTYFNWEYSEAYFPKEQLFNMLISGVEKIEEADSLALYNKVQESDLTFKSGNALTGINMGLNRTNDPALIYPTSGFFMNLTLEEGNAFPFLFGEISGREHPDPAYYKIDFRSSVYFPVFSHELSTLAFKFEAGNIQTYHGEKTEVPVSQRFYSGGSNSIRGWKPMDEDLGPQINKKAIEDLNLDALSIDEIRAFQRNIVPGGFFKLEASAEARLHLGGDFGSVIFFDAGNNWNSYNNFNWNSVAVAAGFGLRYHTPLGPIRIDFGFKLYDPTYKRSFFTKKIYEETFTFQFGIGEAF